MQRDISDQRNRNAARKRRLILDRVSPCAADGG
jgi:hypothetical protein